MFKIILNTRLVFVLILCWAYTFNYAQIRVESDLVFDIEVLQGKSYEGQVLLYNQSEQVQSLQLYLEEYAINKQELKRSNLNWVTLSTKNITLQPNERRSVPYIINIPDDSSLVGSYWSLLAIEPKGTVKAAEVQSEDNDKFTFSIREVVRYGIQINTTIITGAEAKLVFENPEVVLNEEQNLLSVDMKNTGSLFLWPEVYLEIYDSLGILAGRVDGKKRRLYPESVFRQEFDLSTRYIPELDTEPNLINKMLPAGDYTIIMIADSGTEDVFGVQYTVKVE